MPKHIHAHTHSLTHKQVDFSLSYEKSHNNALKCVCGLSIGFVSPKFKYTNINVYFKCLQSTEFKLLFTCQFICDHVSAHNKVSVTRRHLGQNWENFYLLANLFKVFYGCFRFLFTVISSKHKVFSQQLPWALLIQEVMLMGRLGKQDIMASAYTMQVTNVS